MKPDLRISIKDYRRGKRLRVRLSRLPFGPRQFRVWMDGKRWPADGRPVSLSRLFAALRKAVVRAVEGAGGGGVAAAVGWPSSAAGAFPALAGSLRPGSGALRPLMECGGQRRATPLCVRTASASESAVAAALCRRSP